MAESGDSPNTEWMKKLWKFVFSLIMILFAYLGNCLYVVRRDFDPKGKQYLAPWIHHTVRLLIASFFVVLVRGLIKYLTADAFLRQYCSINEKVSENYFTKIKALGSNLFWYLFITVLGYGWVARNNVWVPKTLGGEMDPNQVYGANWPLIEIREIDYLYFYLQFGSKFYSLLNTIVNEKDFDDFWEMFLHHIIAVVLMILSLFLNTPEIGIIVLLIHDPGDLGYNFGKFYKYILAKKYKFEVIDGIVYPLIFLSWIIPRLIIQPISLFSRVITSFSIGVDKHVVLDLPKDVMTRIYHLAYFAFSVLTILYLMNVYWSWMALAGMLLSMKKKDFLYGTKSKNE